jgi:hypothetical protein
MQRIVLSEIRGSNQHGEEAGGEENQAEAGGEEKQIKKAAHA